MSAFGKDPSKLNNVTAWRQQAEQFRQKRDAGRRQSFNRRPPPIWVGKYQPTTTAPPDLGRLLAGQYEVEVAVPDGKDDYRVERIVLPYYPWVEHFDGVLERGTICSGGPLAFLKDRRQPCRGCDIYWETRVPDPKTGRMKRGRMGRREMNTFSWLHHMTYAKAPVIDSRTGQVKTKENGEQILAWTKVEPHLRLQYSQFEQKPAHVLHWSLGSAHWETLWNTDKLIGMSCTTCGQKDAIQTTGWVCNDCGHPLIDMATTTYPMAEIDKLTSKDMTCGHCGYTGRPYEMFACLNCSPLNRTPTRATVFDVDMSVMRVLTSGDGGNQTALQIPSWSEPRPIDPQLQEIAKPLPLDRIFAPTPYEEQVEIFGPPKAQDTAGSTPYSR